MRASRHWILISLLTTLFLAGCAGSAPAVTTPPTTTTPQTVLIWEGKGPWGDTNETACKQLQIDNARNIAFGACAHTAPAEQPAQPEFAQLVAQIAPFEYTTPQDRLTFHGQGTRSGPAWQHAVLRWTHETYTEAVAGHACASCRTLASWSFGAIAPQSALCTHLTITHFGYAYAETRPCAGGPVQHSNGGWLETSEWQQLDAWSATRAASYQGDNYLDGTGKQPMSDTEMQQLASLTTTIYTRLAK